MSKLGKNLSARLPVLLFLFLGVLGAGTPGNLMAGNELQPTGARPLALGNAFTGVRGSLWSLYYNPAGIIGTPGPTAGIHIERRFLMSEMNYGSFGFIYPFKEKHVAAIDGSGFGFGNYSEAKVGLTYATLLADRLSLGAKVNIAQTSIRGYGSATSIFVDLGFHALITEELSLGFHVYNASQGNIRKEISEKIPTIFTLGLAYQVSDKVLVVSDLQKHVNFPISYRGGIEYLFDKQFTARAGVTTAPVSFNAGLGFNAKGLQIDFANTYYMEVYGYTPSLSLTYQFGKNSAQSSSLDE